MDYFSFSNYLEENNQEDIVGYDTGPRVFAGCNKPIKVSLKYNFVETARKFITMKCFHHKRLRKQPTKIFNAMVKMDVFRRQMFYFTIYILPTIF